MRNQSPVPYQHSDESKRIQIEKMFDKVSEKYDFLNRIITFGMDQSWRKKVLKLISSKNPKKILDVATGTGDMAILFSQSKATEILGIDISKGMLSIAEEKIKAKNLDSRVSVQVQDSENMSFVDNSFDAVSVCYGIRNFENLAKGLAEIHRVMRPNGVFVILETSVPNNIFLRQGYMFYTKYVMPRMASLFSKDSKAYNYLSDSALKFPYGNELKIILENAGFKNVKVMPQMGGVSTIYYAEK